MIRIQKFIFWLLIFSIPFQVGRHFWPLSSVVAGRRIDYLSPTIYATDILLFISLLILVLQKKIIWKKRPLIIVFTALLINTVLAANPAVTLTSNVIWLRLLVFYSVLYYRRPKLTEVLIPLGLSALVSFAIGLAQFTRQSSAGGWLYYLGERSFTQNTPGISLVDVGGRLLLRAYAAFPHPNVFGGFSAIVGLWFIIWHAPPKFRVYRRLFIGAALFGLFITFSRTAWVAFIGGWLVWKIHLSRKNIRKIIIPLVMAAAIILSEEMLVGRVSNLWTTDNSSFVQRRELAKVALSMWQERPFFGWGWGGFLTQVPRYTRPPFLIQPPHSVFLIILTETGLIGAVLVLIYISQRARSLYKKDTRLLCLLGACLFLGAFDHYLVTLKSTQFLMALVLWSDLLRDA